MCPLKCTRSWSHASWVKNYKMFIKKLLAVCPKALTRMRKRRKKNIGSCKAFCITRKRKKTRTLIIIVLNQRGYIVLLFPHNILILNFSGYKIGMKFHEDPLVVEQNNYNQNYKCLHCF